MKLFFLSWDLNFLLQFDGEGASTGEGASSEGGASCTSPPDGKDDKTKKKNRCAVCRKKLGLTGTFSLI